MHLSSQGFKRKEGCSFSAPSSSNILSPRVGCFTNVFFAGFLLDRNDVRWMKLNVMVFVFSFVLF